ncbi:MAG: phosphoribosylglycinamide formyltransferase [Myxococcales bacterium]|nr:phosphoribosylglycinamide formyltransferase [Myxococcales bacterium]MCB9531189.1 phosphoribosylglycinamide formyltransferase [Myxococcales bacterium]MCB9534501.1 phosphoribosylglycinamide formyltransferase [Myxococcales bacterium]
MTDRVVGGAAVDRALPPFAILASGRGSNLAAICSHDDLRAACVGVIVSSHAAAAARRAADVGLPVATVTRADLPSRSDFDAALAAQLGSWGASWVVLAGFMHILGDAVLDAFPRRVVNIHPSLLPAFPGLHPHRQALAAGVSESGCTVHLVVPGAVDGGPIVAQSAVPVVAGDDEESLAARVLAAEHDLYPRTLRALLTTDG